MMMINKAFSFAIDSLFGLLLFFFTWFDRLGLFVFLQTLAGLFISHSLETAVQKYIVLNDKYNTSIRAYMNFISVINRQQTSKERKVEKNSIQSTI